MGQRANELRIAFYDIDIRTTDAKVKKVSHDVGLYKGQVLKATQGQQFPQYD